MRRQLILPLLVATTLAAPRLAAQEAALLDSVRSYARGTAACASEQPDARADVVHTPAAASNEFFPRFFCFAAGGRVFSLSAEGVGLAMEAGGAETPFRLPVEEGEIEQLVYKLADGRLYLHFHVNYGDGAMGYLAALDAATLRPAWSHLPSTSLNLGPVLLRGGAAYVTGTHVVGKIDLDTGLYAWKHAFFVDESPEAVPFSGFEVPQVAAGRVRFAGEGDAAGAPRVLIVDDATGAILQPSAYAGRAPTCRGSEEWCSHAWRR